MFMKWYFSGRRLYELQPGQGAHPEFSADHQGYVWHGGGVPGGLRVLLLGAEDPPRLKLELATRMPATQALELLHSRLHHVQVRPRQHSLLPTPQGRQPQHCRPRARGAATAPRREKGSQRRPPVSLPTSTHHRSIVQESVSISELPFRILLRWFQN